jgi:hypothetical protein
MTLTDLPWDRAPHLPWRMFTSPAARWAVMPSFVVGEYLFYACALVALAHAWTRGPLRRKYLLAWALALLAGTTNDMIFMALPLVNNFWQAQATIMLTPRLPLYIPCVYVCFMYFPTVAAWRTNLPLLPRACLTGLAASIFYAPYDIVGAKFLWWTWHDSDPPIANRILGAPIGSTMWIITFVAAFSGLLGRAVDRDPLVSGKTIAKAALLVCGLCTLTMMVQMTALQQLDHGVPGIRGLVAVSLLFAGIALHGLRKSEPMTARDGGDRVLHAAVVLYFATLAILMAAFDPATHRSASMHQTYGPCRVESTDITGQKRFKYLCAEDFDEDFSFQCAPSPPPPESEWYTVCGRPHTSFGRWMFGVSALGVVGIGLFSYLLGALRGRRREPGQSMAPSA